MATVDLGQILLLMAIAVPTLVVASFPLHALVALGRARRREGIPSGSRSVSVIVPVRGLDENMSTIIAKLASQRVRGRLEIIFCVERGDDPVVPVIRRVARSRPPDAIQLVISGPRGSSLGKSHNLSAGVRAARGEWLVFMDSDVTLPHQTYLDAFVRALGHDPIGLVTCFPAYREANTIPAALLATSINNDLLGYFAVQATWSDLRLANGSCMAIRRDVLDAIGGLARIQRSLLMDSILARQVADAGYDVHIHPQPAPVIRREVSAREWWRQSHRWQVAMSRVLPWPLYAGFCWMRSGFVLSLLYAAAYGVTWLSLGVVAAALMARLMSSGAINVLYLKDPRFLGRLWLLPVVEVVNAVSSLYALVNRHVVWRDVRYTVGVGGAVVETPSRVRATC